MRKSHNAKWFQIIIIAGVSCFAWGCSQEKKKLEVRSPAPLAADHLKVQLDRSPGYEFEGIDSLGRSCSTGERVFSSQEEMCEVLTLSEENRDCAETERREDFKKNCSGDFDKVAGLALKQAPRFSSPGLSGKQLLVCSFVFYPKSDIGWLEAFLDMAKNENEVETETEVETAAETQAGDKDSISISENDNGSSDDKGRKIDKSAAATDGPEFMVMDQRRMLREEVWLRIGDHFYARVTLEPVSHDKSRKQARLQHSYLRQEIIYLDEEHNMSVPLSYSGILVEQIGALNALKPLEYVHPEKGLFALSCELEE